MGFFLPNPYAQMNAPQISQTQIGGRFTKYLTSTPQNCQGHEKQGNTKRHTMWGAHRREDDRSVGPSVESGTGRGRYPGELKKPKHSEDCS